MTLTVGLDLSLSSTGLAAMVDGRLVDTENIVTRGRNGATYSETMPRIIDIAYQVDQWVKSLPGEIDIAVIEAPSYRSSNGKPHERAGLWWQVFGDLWADGVTMVAVSPATRASYITGNGRAKKPEVFEHARARYDQEALLIPNHDVADAAGMAAMASRRLGHIAEPMEIPDRSLKSFEGVRWPTATAE